MTEAELTRDLVAYVNREFVHSGQTPVDAGTPLLEHGILDSMRAMLLLVHVRDDLGLPVSPADVDPWDLRSLAHLTTLLSHLPTGSAP